MACEQQITHLERFERMRDCLEGFVSSLQCERESENALKARNHVDNKIRSAPVGGARDAAVKLRSVVKMFEDGPRLDGSDERVLRDVIEWLEAN